MRVATLIALGLLTLPAHAAQLTAAASHVTVAQVEALAASHLRSLSATSVAPGGSDDGRLAGLRAAMDGMSFVEPDDVMELRAAVRGGFRPSSAMRAALGRLDAVEARSDARVLAAVSGPTPVRLDATPTDLAPMVTAAR